VILDRATRRDGLPGVLVQRDTELSRLSRLVKAVRQGEPAVTMVVGAPGTGRTSLLAHAVRVAHDNGVQVMAATGAETESGLRYGVVSQLLAAEPDQAARDLLRRLASSDETVIPVLCGYFVARSRRVPLLVVIDDVHLADEQSRLWLQAMARRLNGTSTMLLLSGNSMLSRLPADPAWSFAGSMQASRRHHHVIRSSPLDEDGVREIVGRQRGHAPSDLIKRLADSTLGNPAVLSAVLARLTGPERESQAVALAHGIRRERTQILLAQLSPDLLSLLKGGPPGGSAHGGG
jgi:predicted ATPase